jgi:hypothetical protein
MACKFSAFAGVAKERRATMREVAIAKADGCANFFMMGDRCRVSPILSTIEGDAIAISMNNYQLSIINSDC